ncbi:MAG: carboxynorspermidine decarboxylase [Rhizobiales bacterium]|nr:carboxynorspermidine decarboxylase [Hyphomicrobiales bacterium]
MSDVTENGMPQSGEARDFARFKLDRVSTPCFVVDEVAIESNLKILADVKVQSGAKVFLALKAFSMFSLAPLVMKYLDGVCASGVYEARLAKEKFCLLRGEVATYCAAFKADDMRSILETSDHVIFNSVGQKEKYGWMVKAANKHVGLRINPEHSEGTVPRYDPCSPNSRLGVPISQITADDLAGVDGIHMHTLCEQGFEPLQRTWQAALPKLKPYLADLKWINFGGGHHITRDDYDRAGLIAMIKEIRETYELDVYLEPGEAVALDAGILVGEIIDITKNEMNLAITNISATCHMPDVTEAPYRPAMLGEGDAGDVYRFGGPSCLAGDVIGDYQRDAGFAIGDRFAFLDQAHYSMVKTNTFNGIPLPSIVIWNSKTDELKTVRKFGYDDFLNRLS